MDKNYKVLKGRHSVVYVDLNTGLARKVFKPELFYNFYKEVSFLSYLQPFNFVPKLYSADFLNLSVEMEYIEGVTLGSLVEKKEFTLELALECLSVCRKLDELMIQKEEMNRPEKHIIFRNGKPYFIDFERGVITAKPANLTQFLSYLSKIGLIDLSKIVDAVKKYRKSYSEEDYKRILELIGVNIK